MSKKAKTDPVSTSALDDSEDEDKNQDRNGARSPSPRRKVPSASSPTPPSQEAAHAEAKGRAAAMVSKLDLMKKDSESRTVSGTAPVRIASGGTIGDATMKGIIIGYSADDKKMSMSVVPIEMNPKSSFDVYGSTNPYMSGLITTHRPKNAVRPKLQRKDGSPYDGAFPKTISYIPKGKLVPNVDGQIGVVSAGSMRRMNQYLSTAYDKEDKSSKAVNYQVGDVVTFTGMSCEDMMVYGYERKKGNEKATPPVPPESDEVYENRLAFERNAEMSERKFALKFKNVEASKKTNVNNLARIHMVGEMVNYLYKNADFQENITMGLMSAHAGWKLAEFDESAHAEEDLEQKRLEYEGAKSVVSVFHKKRNEELLKISDQMKRNIQEVQTGAKGINMKHHLEEPGPTEKISIMTEIASDLEAAGKNEPSRLEAWDMPYYASKYNITMVFKGGEDGFGENTHALLSDKDCPRMFTDFAVEAVTPKSQGQGYVLQVHTMTVSDRIEVSKQLEKGASGALLDSRKWYSPNEGSPPLIVAGFDGMFSVAWKVQSPDHLSIAAYMMATNKGNGIITSTFSARKPGFPIGEISPTYIDMIVPDVICKLQSSCLEVSQEWLKANLCHITDDPDSKDGKSYKIYSVLTENNVVDVKKSSAFSDATCSLQKDGFANLHELSSMMEFKNLIKNDQKFQEIYEKNKYGMQFRVMTCISAEGDLLDCTEGVTRDQMDHINKFGAMSTADAQSLLEEAAKKNGMSMFDFLKAHTIPYVILVDSNGNSV